MGYPATRPSPTSATTTPSAQWRRPGSAVSCVTFPVVSLFNSKSLIGFVLLVSGRRAGLSACSCANSFFDAPAGRAVDRTTPDRHPVNRAQPPETAGLAIVALPAEIDIANAEQVWHRLSAALAPGGEGVVAALSATTLCAAGGIRALRRVRAEAPAPRVELRLAVPPGRVRHLLELLSLDRQLAIYPSASQAAGS